MEKSIFKKGLGIFLLLSLLTLLPLSAAAQKFALVDMEYIFKNIPAYERANEQLNQVSKKWQAEVEGKYNVQKLSERVGIPLSRAEKDQARANHE